MLVDRVLAREAGLEQLLGEQLGSDLDSGSQVHRRRGELSGRNQSWQQRGGRDHDDARLSGNDLGQGTRAGRGDLQVRRQAPIGIDLVAGQGHDRVGDGSLAQPLESIEEIPRVDVSSSTSASVGTTTTVRSFGAVLARKATYRPRAAGVSPDNVPPASSRPAFAAAERKSARRARELEDDTAVTRTERRNYSV